MRTIKFRGQRIDNGEWVYGFLYQLPLPTGVGCMILTTDNTHEDNSIEPEYHLAFTLWVDLFPVKPETVGQYTDLQDKNDVDIYKGDILRSPSGNIVAVEFGYKEHVVKHGRPQITDSFACYGWIARNVKNGITDFFDNEFAAGEVIGNIYDNPELLNKKLSA